MANMHLVTGYAGREHITSIDQGLLNSYIFGNLEIVMERGNQFAASIISNNIIRVRDGDLLMQGRFARLNDDSYVDLTIENGTQGYYRNDLIVARYQKDTLTAVETVDLVVIKGENSTSAPADPSHVKGDIRSGTDFQNDVPLWRVSLNGLNVTGLTCLYSTFSASLLNHADRHGVNGDDRIKPADIDAVSTAGLKAHLSNTSNPHYVTSDQVAVTEKVLNAFDRTGNWSVEGILTHVGHTMFNREVLYRWMMTKRTVALNNTGTVSFRSLPVTVYQSSEVTVNADGTISMVNPTHVVVDNTQNVISIPSGYFFASRTVGLSEVYKATPSTTTTVSTVAGQSVANLSDVETWIPTTSSNIAASTDPDVHADGDIDENGYTYTEIDPITEFVPLVATGSYEGTGTYGKDNPNSVTLPFVPKFFVCRSADSHLRELKDGVIYIEGISNTYCTLSGTTLSWYDGTSDDYQANKTETYVWFAIG